MRIKNWEVFFYAVTLMLAILILTSISDAQIPPTSMTRVVFLSFDKDIPGTIHDVHGYGTGFTDRLPYTGWGIPSNDPNLDLLTNPGKLTITSTHFDINGSKNLEIAETLGVKLGGIDIKDFKISALFRNVQISELSDQLLLYVATDPYHVFRTGMHYTSSREFVLGQSVNGQDFGAQSVGTFNDGDDVQVTLTRTGGSTYTMLYEDMTSGNIWTDEVTFHWLDSASDLYVGVLYANNAGKDLINPKISQVDEFSVYLAVQTVMIDIKPESDPNTINRGSKGNVPVAILGSSAFDATTVDWSTVIFAGASPLTIGEMPEDINGDGLLDVILHFNTRDLQLQAGDTEACLSGKTLGGQDFKGCDSVRIVK